MRNVYPATARLLKIPSFAAGALIILALLSFAGCEETSLLSEIQHRVDEALGANGTVDNGDTGDTGDTGDGSVLTVASPQINPSAGTYTSDQSVTIQVATSGATIYYTNDGTEPTTASLVYSEEIPFRVSGRDLTVKAIATAPGMEDSEVVTVSYDILFAVGATGPAGGIVFYDKSAVTDGWRYLEAAASDQSAGVPWSNGEDLNIENTEITIGTGQANTDLILAAQGAGEYAAQLCDDLVISGFDDWFLPAIDTVDLMFELRDTIGGFSGNYGDYYWSSSQVYGYAAYTIWFWNSDLKNGNKDVAYRVRAVRSF